MSSTVWTPSPLEMMTGMVAVLADTVPSDYDALFVHASPVRDDRLDARLLDRVAQAYHSGADFKVVINGLTEDVCQAKNLAYLGYERWYNILVQFGVSRDDILVLEAAGHTGAEARNLLRLAKEYGWKKLVISSQPHHQLRCFLQAIALMDEEGWYPAVYNLPAPGISWHHEMKKPVMTGGTGATGDVLGTLPEHIVREFESIEMYAQEPKLVEGRPAFTRNATIPEMLQYMELRRR